MKLKLKISLILCFISFFIGNGLSYSSGVNKANDLSPLEREVFHEINLARTAPKDYASFLEQFKKYYHGKRIEFPNETPILTEEGVGALMEAIRFLQSAKPVPLLSLSKGMSLGAKDHVKNLGLSGGLHHQGSDKSQPWDRVNRYGTWQKVIGENISLGYDRPSHIVMSLIIDDGVPTRGHRKNIFNSDFRVMGVACGEHPHYKTVCVITFAGEYIEREKK
jgi:uncharacterized protein YkwD